MRNVKAMFDVANDWATKFEADNQTFGGDRDFSNDERLIWLDSILSIKGKRVLELGPLEGGHTKMFLDLGASKVIALEGHPHCWVKCLIVQQVYNLTKAKFILCDFCEYLKQVGERFDLISASGVLYHQLNPINLIYEFSRLTNHVFVWSQVASDLYPSQTPIVISQAGNKYKGKINDYGTARDQLAWWGGLNQTAVWLYPQDLRDCFMHAGFLNITEIESAPTPFGDSVLFLASK